MRLWHKDLLPYLDDFHIIAQYRELLAIKKAIDKNGTPNHRLVNKVLDYSLLDFKVYTIKVEEEMNKRNIKHIKSKFEEVMSWKCDKFKPSEKNSLYEGWHNNRYLIQCYYNLEEKYDCGIVSENAWKNINKFMRENYVNLLLKQEIKKW